MIRKLAIILDGTRYNIPDPRALENAIHITEGIEIIGMPASAREGRPTVLIHAPIPNSKYDIWIETSLRNFRNASQALSTHHYKNLEGMHTNGTN